jgi:hypothetical protein
MVKLIREEQQVEDKQTEETVDEDHENLVP